MAYISTGASGFAPSGAEVKGESDSPDVMYPRGEWAMNAGGYRL